MGSEFITGVIIQKIYEEILSEPLEPIMDFDN
jgi:hypothetical protein